MVYCYGEILRLTFSLNFFQFYYVASYVKLLFPHVNLHLIQHNDKAKQNKITLQMYLKVKNINNYFA